MTTVKKINLFAWLFGALFISMMSFIACENKPKDSEEAAKEMNEPKSDLTKESDERFLVRAAEINLEEIQLSQLAQQRGTMAEVKELGKMMEEAHTKANADLKALASQKGIAVPLTPTADAQDAHKNLNEKSGNDFDREYCDKMVKGHKDAIDLFEGATKGNNDPDVKAWAAKMLPDLRTHLAHAQTCEDKLKQLSDKTN